MTLNFYGILSMLIGPVLVHIGSLCEIDIQYKYAILYYILGVLIDLLI